MLAGEVVVVLEDDELVRRATERLLRRFGAEVGAGRRAGEVLESLTARGLVHSCIVVDFWLSREENGLSAVTRLRESAGGHPRRLVVTGELSRDTAEAVTTAGPPTLPQPVE